MFDIKFLKSTGFFKEVTLDTKELLFDEGDIDNNFYIIVSGRFSIEKYTTPEKNATKQLALLKKGDFLGEGSLNSYFPKEVKVLALQKSKILCIDAKKDFGKFLDSYPEQTKDMLVYIISITNRRVSQGNKYITSIYEINKSIRELQVINFKEIFKILDKINSIMEGDFLLFLEKNSVMEDYLTLKYDSRKNGKMQDAIVKKGEYKLDEIGIEEGYKIITKEISIGKEGLGNIIVGRQSDFKENEKRVFLGMINSLAGVLKQKKILEEERDKAFSKI